MFIQPPTLHARTNGARHNCAEHLVERFSEWTEPHGERCHQEWIECAVCGVIFEDASEVPDYADEELEAVEAA